MPTAHRTRTAAPALLVLIAALCQGAPRGVAGEPAGAGGDRRPNIVFILIDDMGWPDVGCYGHPFHETPHIDRLASEGVRFTDFYASSPVCSSTRASIQSGQYPARVGITDFIPGHWRPFEKLVVPPIENALPLGIETPAEALRKVGYATGYFGKWHLGGKDHGPEAQGYDVTGATLQRDEGFRRWRGERPPGPKQIDLLTDQTLWFLKEQRDRPFLVTLSHHAVHIPVEATEAEIEKYRKKRRPATGVNHPVYAAMVADTDRSVGRILERLEELDLVSRTLVVFTSDNGGLRRIYTGVGEVVSTNAPLRDEKGTIYEGGIRVPFIARWPGAIPAGGTCGEPATTADLLPTFCEAAGAGLPAQPIDGRSLLRILRDPSATLDREAIYFHYPHYHHSRPAGAVRAGDWKLIELFDDGSLELYNLRQDIGEEVDLSVRYPERAAALRERLAAWREAVGARMPSRNPDHDPERAAEWWNRGANRPLDIEAMERRYRTRTGREP